MKLLRTVFAAFVLLSVFLADVYAWGWRDRIRNRLAGRLESQRENLSSQSSDPEYFLEFQGLRRRYVLHAPSSISSDNPAPLVVVLHGGMGSPEGTAIQTGMNLVADENNFYVVYPQGWGDFSSWNAGVCCGEAKAKNLDDVGFIRAVIGDISARQTIDKKRIYATGLSNGGMMTYRLAVEASDIFAAVSPVATDLEIFERTASRPMPILHFHGLQDDFAPFQGGHPRKGPNRDLNRSGVPKTIDWWVRANHCAPIPASSEKTADYEKIIYEPASGQNGAPIILYKLWRGGHTWPGGQDVSRMLGTGYLVKGVDASRLMWEFFKQYSFEN